MLHSLIDWVKDPFNRQEIEKHNKFIEELYSATETTHQTNQKVLASLSRRAIPRVMGGANAIDRSILGTYQRTRKRHYEHDDDCN